MGKTILWVEDFDSRKGGARKNPKLNQDISQGTDLSIFNNTYKNILVVKERFYDAICFIYDNINQFDLVILDVDMNRNFGSINREDKIWVKFFAHINIQEEKRNENGIDTWYIKQSKETTSEHIQKYAGYYLVILLLSLGFPKDRILMFTAYGYQNGNDERVKKWEEKFDLVGLYPPKIIDKGIEWQGKLHLDLNKELQKKYTEINEYYWVRAMVYLVIDYVEDYINKNKDEMKILNNPFNKMVEKKKLDSEKIIELFQKMKSDFTLFKPINEGDVYYKALKQLTEPFEAEYNKGAIDSEYRLLKLFRNWSAHSRFEENEIMNSTTFIFLFMITTNLYLEEFNCDIVFNTIANTIFGKCPKTEKVIIEQAVEKKSWELCKTKSMVPDNMFEVFHKLGNKEKVKYSYLFWAYISCCCEKKINYNEDSFTINYQFRDNLTSMQKDYIIYAYDLWNKY